MRNRIVAALLLTFLLITPVFAGLGSDKAMYVGGTISKVEEKAEGKISLGDKALTFDLKSTTVEIPYAQIDSLEYGQKAGRRVGMAVVINPLFIFSHKRRHYLTIGFVDNDKKQQAGVFEIGKGGIKNILSGLEAKTGKKVEYQDAEARKAGTGS